MNDRQWADLSDAERSALNRVVNDCTTVNCELARMAIKLEAGHFCEFLTDAKDKDFSMLRALLSNSIQNDGRADQLIGEKVRQMFAKYFDKLARERLGR